MKIKRRDFLKLGVAGAATLAIGRIPGLGVKNAYAATTNLVITITDGLKDMVTKNAVSALITDPNPVPAQCYFWVYQMIADGVPLAPDCPGPTIMMIKGQSINLTITNNLTRNHSFYIPGIYDSGPIAPGATVNGVLTASIAGPHMYYDRLNAPVNRVMGLHGGLVVRPSAPALNHNYTPYDNPSPHVQALYDSFGTSVFPGLKWEQAGPGTPPAPGENVSLTGNTYCPPFRQYVWLLHQASPNLFKTVGDTPGDYDAQLFQTQFLKDPFSPTRANNIPQYFTINGQSGFFSHFSPTVTPMGRVGEPIVIHIMNAGLWTHSMHFHFNHFYVTYDSGEFPATNGVSPNPIWIDIYNVDPMDKIDYTLPFMRSPNIPTVRGLGLPETPAQTINGHPCWPPLEEMNLHFPKIGTKAKDVNGNDIPMEQRLSPLCYPMHDHSEPSQTAQGGNYNCGLISGAYCTGDRNTPGFVNFPMEADFQMMYRNIRGVSSVNGSGVLDAPGTPPA